MISKDELIVLLLDAVRAGIDMRVKQTIYFKLRINNTNDPGGKLKTAALIASKNAEKAFDDLAARSVAHLKPDAPP